MPGCAYWRDLARRSALAHYTAGQSLIAQGEFDAALRELSDAIRNDPALTTAHIAAGDVHFLRGDHGPAQEAYEAACRADPYSFQAHYKLGATYEKLAEATKKAGKVLAMLRKALRAYLRSVELEPGDYDANMSLCGVYYRLGKYRMAEHYCRAGINSDPENPEAYLNLGIIYDSQGRFYEAVRAYKASLELDTRQPRLLIHLGSTYLRRGRLRSALKAYQLASDLTPTDAEPWIRIGACHYHRRDFPAAVKAFETALSLDGREPAAYRGLGVAYMAAFLADHRRIDLRDQALAAWRQSLALKPDQPVLRRLRRKYATYRHRPGRR